VKDGIVVRAKLDAAATVAPAQAKQG
jgi:hypothetical protein